MAVVKKTLIQRLKESDEAALKEMYQKFYPKLFYFANEYVKETFQVENIVNDSFVSLWNNRHDLIESSNVTAYLFTITKNKCINFINRELVKYSKNISLSEKKNELLTNREAISLLNFENFDLEVLQQKINDIIEKLPKKTQEIFKLSRIEEYKNREISEKYDLPIKTVEYHITKALKVLKSELKEYYVLLPILVQELTKL